MKNKTEKKLIEGKWQQDFIVKSSFVADTKPKPNPNYREVVYVDKEKNIAMGTMRCDSIYFYEKVANEYNGETLYHREIHLSPDDIKTLYKIIIEIEEYHGEGEAPDDLPF